MIAASRRSPTMSSSASADALSDTVAIDTARSRRDTVTGSANTDSPVGPAVRSDGSSVTRSRGSSSPSSTSRQNPASNGSL
jgi:hypothetical protein